MTISGQVQYINPDDLSKNPAFTNVVAVTGPAKTIYIGRQEALDAFGTIVGKGDIKQRVEQVLYNLQVALKAGGARVEPTPCNYCAVCGGMGEP